MSATGNKYHPFIRVLLFFLILLPFVSIGQKLSAFQNYTHLSDFTQNSIQAIHQDKEGYIWIGTESGLNRYDGRRITSYKTGLNNNFTLTSKRINQIEEDDAGNLWLATSTGGINIIAPKKDPATNELLRALSDSLNKIMGTELVGCVKLMKNKIMVMGMDSGICTYNTITHQVKKIPVFDYKGLHIKCDVVNIEEDVKGRCIVASSTGGVFVLSTDFIVTGYYEPTLFESGNEPQLIDVVCTPGNVLFVASANGVFKIYLDSNKPPARLIANGGIDLSTLRVNCMAYDATNKWVLLGSNSAGVITIDTAGILVDQLIDDKKIQRLQSNTVYSFLVDDTGMGYWIGTRSGLTKFFFAEDKFSTFQVKTEEDASPLPIYPVYTEDNIHVLTGTSASLVVHDLHTGEKKDILIPEIQTLRFNCIVKFTDGFYLYGTRNGIYYSTSYLEPVLKKISTIYPELDFMDKSSVLCFLPLDQDQVLMGARGDQVGGLLLWDRDKHIVQHFLHTDGDPSSLPDNSVNYIAKTPAGKILVCTNKGICYFNTGLHSFEPVFDSKKITLNYPHVSTVLAEDSVLWIGTYGGGINKYNLINKTIEYITDTSGLANNEIYSIQPGDKGDYWLSTNSGLILYNHLRKEIRNFDKSYGLINNEFNRISSFKCHDTVYFGGLSGVSYFNYRNFKKNYQPPAVDISQISMLKAMEEKMIFPDEHGAITVSHAQNTLKFYLASPFYINPAKTEFFYRILPNQREWISNGTNNELIITQLPPGKHQLEVKTRNSEGIFSTSVKTIYIIVTPPWYQTWWFRILLGIMIAAIFFGFYKLRIAQLKKENKIRNQLASDLHDDLGSTLNSVKVYSNLAMMEKENKVHLEKIKESTQNAIAGVRDLIWVLDDKKDTVRDLVTRISLFALPLCDANHIRFIEQVGDDARDHKLEKEEKRNLYMILKESINNSIKYADCKLITLRFETVMKKLSITIADDGGGFDSNTIKEGNGLKNMRDRAKAIGFTIHITGAPGNGTDIKLEKS